MKTLLAILLAGGSLAAAESLTPWAEWTDNHAIRVVNRVDPVENHLAGGKLGRDDEQVLIDFMDCDANRRLEAAAKREGNTLAFTGSYRFSKEAAPFVGRGGVEVLAPDHLQLSLTLSAEAPQEVKESFWSLRFNRTMLDRELTFTVRGDKGTYQHRVKLPLAQKDGWVWSSPKGQPIEAVAIPLMHGELVLSGFSLPAMVCKYGDRVGNLRFYLGSGSLAEIKGKLDIRFRPYRTVALDLAKAANVGFADEVADDGKGGWTDQGPENDLRSFPAKDGVFGNIAFKVIDPARNGGRSVLAFANPERSYFLREAVAEGKGNRFDYLYLLHAGAWCRGGAMGTIRVDYEDGSHDLLAVDDRRDVANWWGGIESFSNATLVWRSQNRSSLVGLYLSRFRVKNRPIQKLTFTTADRAVWLVVAAAGVTGEPPFPRGSDIEVPWVIEEGKEWKAFTFSKNRAAGSAIDFSGYLDAPAGKYGRVIVKDGRFVFEKRPEKAVRFLGGNICFDSNYLEHAETDILVDRVAKAGYNAIRLHHFDNELIKPGATTPEFDPERLDRLFYLIARAKERGLYVTIDLYISRLTGFSQAQKDPFDVKSRLLFQPEMRENLKEYSRKLLTTVNPHTGLALKDDPALITIGLINEDPLATHHEQLRYPNSNPERQALIEPVWKEWCARHRHDPAKVDKETYLRFLLDRHIAVFEEFKTYLTGIGVTAPLSDISAGTAFALAVPRARFDYVDLHFYFDHPSFPGEFFKMPFQNHNRSAVKDGFQNLFNCGGFRVEGKPFTVTEFNFCVPNVSRGEGGPAVGAFAAFQEWDGLFRFQYHGYSRKYKQQPLADGGHLGSFGVDNDPIQGLSELITNLFYLRGDVAPGRDTAVLAIPEKAWEVPGAAACFDWNTLKQSLLPDAYLRAGLVRRIGLAVRPDASGPTGIAEVLKTGKFLAAADNAKERYTSSTGEIVTDVEKGTFRVVTPRSEALVIPGSSLEGKRLKVSGNTVFSTIFAGSLDAQPLEKSRRVLVLHLTDVKATGQKWGAVRDQLRMYNWGNFSPYLVRRGNAKITLDLEPGEYIIRTLSVDGTVLSESTSPAPVTFTAATDSGPSMAAVFAYEILRKR